MPFLIDSKDTILLISEVINNGNDIRGVEATHAHYKLLCNIDLSQIPDFQALEIMILCFVAYLMEMSIQ